MRNFIVRIPSVEAGPQWLGGSPQEQGYAPVLLPNLRRVAVKDNEYHVYNDDVSFETVEAGSASDAVQASKIERPFRIVHAFCRMDTICGHEKLEFVEKSAGGVEQAQEEDQPAEEAPRQEAKEAKAPEEAKVSEEIKQPEQEKQPEESPEPDSPEMT